MKEPTVPDLKAAEAVILSVGATCAPSSTVATSTMEPTHRWIQPKNPLPTLRPKPEEQERTRKIPTGTGHLEVLRVQAIPTTKSTSTTPARRSRVRLYKAIAS